jgi:hypothetical protein
LITTELVRRRVRSFPPYEVANVIAAVTTAPVFRDYRAAAERARRTGKAQIVRTGASTSGPFVERVWPVSYKPTLVTRSQRYERENQAAEQFLHRAICIEEDWVEVPRLTARLRPLVSLGRKQVWGEQYRGSLYHAHSVAECEAPTWSRLEKRRGDLRDGLEAAAGLLPELAELRPWPGCILVREHGRASRRGRPSLKHNFYRLAADYAAAARRQSGKLPWGFFPALARHLSLPPFGITFKPLELRVRTSQIETRLTALGEPVRPPCE